MGPTILILLAAASLCTTRVLADFVTGQAADMALGGIEAAGQLHEVSGIAVDPATQKVFVSDAKAHRILRFSSSASLENGGLAEAVIGQTDMAGNQSGLGATRLNEPRGLAIDSAGRLWVADSKNHRVLRFDLAASIGSGAAANAVFGQPNFVEGFPDLTSHSMNFPRDVATDTVGRLWVADSGNKRVLRFDQAATLPNGPDANGILGQPVGDNHVNGAFADPQALAVENSGANTTWLWVADPGNRRVVGFSNPASKPDGDCPTRFWVRPVTSLPVASFPQPRTTFTVRPISLPRMAACGWRTPCPPVSSISQMQAASPMAERSTSCSGKKISSVITATTTPTTSTRHPPSRCPTAASGSEIRSNSSAISAAIAVACTSGGGSITGDRQIGTPMN